MNKNIMKRVYASIMRVLCPSVFETMGTSAPITISVMFFQKVLGFNRSAYWPMHFTSKVTGVKNIDIGIGAAPGLSPGCYIQGGGEIRVGDYTLIAPNVGIISANHDACDHRISVAGSVTIGDYCWIGMNSVVLPGVELGDFTVVAAGAVVKDSFPDGYCVIGGVPARLIKTLDKAACVRYKNNHEYRGYIRASRFKEFRERTIKNA